MAKEKMTKTEAVRQAIAAGQDKPKGGVEWIKGKFGIEMKPNHFSIMKSSLKKSGKGAGKRGRKKMGRPAMNGRAASRSSTSSRDWTSAVRLLTELVEAHGHGKVQQAVTLLGD